MTRKKPGPECPQCLGKGRYLAPIPGKDGWVRPMDCPCMLPMETALETQQRMMKEARDE